METPRGLTLANWFMANQLGRSTSRTFAPIGPLGVPTGTRQVAKGGQLATGEGSSLPRAYVDGEILSMENSVTKVFLSKSNRTPMVLRFGARLQCS
jgi:hypothetical protein